MNHCTARAPTRAAVAPCPGVRPMTRVRRLFVVVAFVGLGAMVSNSSLGQPDKKSGPKGPVVTPQSTPGVQVAELAEAPDSRFTLPGTITYKPLQGDAYFAMQVQPKLEAAPDRPR